MTLVQLRASLRLWQGRVRYRKALHTRAQRDLDRARDGDEHPREHLVKRRDRRARQLEQARAMVKRRQRQVVSKTRGNRRAAAKTSGVGHYDGVPVALWMIPYLDWARQNGWRGKLVSGWRDPNYSRSLCMRMCGAPRCPGSCAGESSNHVGSARPNGAIDVSEYVTFGQLMARCPIQPRLCNRLGARDPVHFSVSGN